MYEHVERDREIIRRLVDTYDPALNGDMASYMNGVAAALLELRKLELTAAEQGGEG